MAQQGMKQVNIDGMKAAMPHFETALSETSRVYSNMSEQAQTLGASWTGDAAKGFIGALNAWLANCNTVRQQLQIVTENLEQNTGGYVQTHTSTTDSAAAIQQAIGAGLPGFN